MLAEPTHSALVCRCLKCNSRHSQGRPTADSPITPTDVLDPPIPGIPRASCAHRCLFLPSALSCWRPSRNSSNRPLGRCRSRLSRGPPRPQRNEQQPSCLPHRGLPPTDYVDTYQRLRQLRSSATPTLSKCRFAAGVPVRRAASDRELSPSQVSRHSWPAPFTPNSLAHHESGFVAACFKYGGRHRGPGRNTLDQSVHLCPTATRA